MIEDFSEVELRALARSYITARHVTCGGDIGMWTHDVVELDYVVLAAEEHECG
jgi:hypothetical protein